MVPRAKELVETLFLGSILGAHGCLKTNALVGPAVQTAAIKTASPNQREQNAAGAAGTAAKTPRPLWKAGGLHLGHKWDTNKGKSLAI